MFANINQQKRSIDFSNSPSQWGNGAGDNGHGDSASDRKKKRKSRWAMQEETDKTIIPGMPTVLPSNLNPEQEKQYILHLQIEEISRRLRTGDLGIPPNPEDRSPSPEPIYNNEGKRLNTREYRTRKKLEEERHRLVQEALGTNSDYKPPADYKPPIIRVNDKVMIPQEEHPDINFVGLLIGPRGNTLKNLEKETGAKIIIRGKGSVKDGKIGRKDGQPLPGEDEPLHAYVTANNPENVKKAVEKIKEIIKQGIEVPEGQNDLRRQQLRELALLNGTLRENDGLAKLKQLQQAQTIVTNTIICSLCGGTGHIAQDCKQKRPGDSFRMLQQQQQQATPVDKAKMDSEYMSLMAELGEGPPPAKQDTSMLPQSRPIHHNPLGQTFRQQFTSPPPNPMAVNQPWPSSLNKPPNFMMNQAPRLPPMSSPAGVPSQAPVQMFQPPTSNTVGLQQQPNMPRLQHHPGQLQQPNPAQPTLQQLQQNVQQQQQVPQPVQPPASITSQFQPAIPTQLPPMSAPAPAPAPAPVAPPASVFSSAGGPVPHPWQTSSAPVSHFSSQASTSLPSVGVPPPPTMLTAPPPPPPNSQSATSVAQAPWMQPPPHNAGPPPPPSSQATGMWQQQQQQNQAPPPPPAGLHPWQQGPPPPMQSPVPAPVAPPPPPPNTGQNYGVVPPPPPPGGFDVNQMSGVNPLLVAPPPPPPN